MRSSRSRTVSFGAHFHGAGPCVLLLLAGAALGPGPAAAGTPGFNLSWDDCFLGAAAIDKTDACDSNTGTHRLILSLNPNGVITDVNGFQGILTIEAAAGTLPDYWHTEAGGARQAKLSADMQLGSTSPPFSCPEPWSAVGNQTAAANLGFPGSYPANMARITFIGAIPGLTTLDGTQSGDWYLMALEYSRALTTSVSGCGVPACFTLEQIRITRPAGTPGGDVFVNLPAISYGVTWQGGGTLQCPAQLGTGPYPLPTDARRSTWGQVKQLYH